MYRYIVVVWDETDRAATAAARLVGRQVHASSPDWRGVLAEPGMLAFHAGANPPANDAILLREGAGAVMGKVFRFPEEDGCVRSVEHLDEEESAAIVASGGRRLVERYWGRYVAALRDRRRCETWIVRDPSGVLPCLHTRYREVDLFFSDVEDFLALRIADLSVNWRHVAALVACPGLRSRDTGLRELSELEAGGAVRIARGSLTWFAVWDPVTMARAEPIEDPGRAAREVRRITRACVHAWAGCHRSLLHRLSGGLDSSIVLVCLLGSPSRPLITAINSFASGPDEDERSFARLVTAGSGCELVETVRRASDVDLSQVLQVSRTPNPVYYLYFLEHSRELERLALERHATAVFSGVGGDAVFYRSRAVLAFADHLRSRGVGPGLLEAALDAARVDRVSVWRILRESFRETVGRRVWSPWNEVGRYATLVNPEVVINVKRQGMGSHPWYSRCDGLGSGKLWHLFSMSVPPVYYDPVGRRNAPEPIAPLVSQPLVELCLRIPTYTLVSGGWDRAVARWAFANDLPPEITRRRTKGGDTDNVRRIFERNLPFIRELLLDGMLVREGLLDRRRLEPCLKPGQSLRSFAFVEIMVRHLSTEAWLHQWAGAHSRRAIA